MYCRVVSINDSIIKMNYVELTKDYQEDLGRMSKSKIAVGMDKVAQALGMSTTEAILPSTGAQLNKCKLVLRCSLGS
jgi:hypothetical protein